MCQTITCRRCLVAFHVGVLPVRKYKGKPKVMPYCMPCWKAFGREKQARRDERKHSNPPFDGMRLTEYEKPLVGARELMHGWRGPVDRECWRVSL